MELHLLPYQHLASLTGIVGSFPRYESCDQPSEQLGHWECLAGGKARSSTTYCYCYTGSGIFTLHNYTALHTQDMCKTRTLLRLVICICGSIDRLINEFKVPSLWRTTLRKPLSRDTTQRLGQSRDLISCDLIPNTILDYIHLLVGQPTSRDFSRNHTYSLQVCLLKLLQMILFQIFRKLAICYQN